MREAKQRSVLAMRRFGAEGINKWDHPAKDAMDVTVVAGGGVLLMRLTARR